VVTLAINVRDISSARSRYKECSIHASVLREGLGVDLRSLVFSELRFDLDIEELPVHILLIRGIAIRCHIEHLTLRSVTVTVCHLTLGLSKPSLLLKQQIHRPGFLLCWHP
jgi:hypothetical protein